MKNDKICVIGHLDWHGNHVIGSVVKARNIYYELKNQFPKRVITNVDIYSWRRKQLSIFLQLFYAFATNHYIILICSDTSKKILSFYYILKRLFKNNIAYCVVGGDIHIKVSENPRCIPALKSINCFFVETEDCISGLNLLGFSNVKLLRNFKKLEPVSYKDIQRPYHKPFRFCIFSRINEQKGITEAINAIHDINTIVGTDVCVLDLFGIIEDDYREIFLKLLSENKEAKYCGIVEADDSVNVLKDYYCLLFPTKYQSEGIPGTIIDAFAAALPVICSDWVRRSQIITDGYNGLVYPFNSFEGLKELILFSIKNPEIMKSIGENSLKSFHLYSPKNAIQPLLSHLK